MILHPDLAVSHKNVTDSLHMKFQGKDDGRVLSLASKLGDGYGQQSLIF